MQTPKSRDEAMIKTYRYCLKGTAARGQIWETVGTVDCEFREVFNAAMRESFQHRFAVGQLPNIGCAGPYDVVQVEITNQSN